jgi:hypothetical protein
VRESESPGISVGERIQVGRRIGVEKNIDRIKETFEIPRLGKPIASNAIGGAEKE